MKSQSKECFAFARTGKCKLGDSCRFQHIVTSKDNNNDDSIECSYYKKYGRCKFGDTCEFKHVAPLREKEKVAEKSVNEVGECSFFSRHGRCKFGDDCRFKHVVPEKQKGHERLETKTCSYFAQHGTCKFGDDCRFVHAVVVPLSAPAITPIPAQEKSKICPYFANHGSCKFGAGCRYSHATTGSASATKKPDKKPQIVRYEGKLCFGFSNFGKCSAGDDCRFAHVFDAAAIDALVSWEPKEEIKPSSYYPDLYYESEDEDKECGWSAIHEVVFHAKYRNLAARLMKSKNPKALVALKTVKDKIIRWSEFDEVDRTSDRYKMTIPAGSTPLDVARTSIRDLDADSPCKDFNVNYLLDSHDDDIHRKLCIIMLKNPEKVVEIVDHVEEYGKYSSLSKFKSQNDSDRSDDEN